MDYRSRSEEELSRYEITETLIEKVLIAREGNIPVSQQYRIKYQEQLHILEEGGSLCLSELRLPEYRDESTTLGESGGGDGKGSKEE